MKPQNYRIETPIFLYENENIGVADDNIGVAEENIGVSDENIGVSYENIGRYFI